MELNSKSWYATKTFRASEMKKVEVFGTIGPSCCDVDTLSSMLKIGMSGVRLNLSHSNLKDCQEWLHNYQEAQKQSGIKGLLLIDMKGPELRFGKLQNNIELKQGELIFLDKTIPIPKQVYDSCDIGQLIMIDDGTLQLTVEEKRQDGLVCRIHQGGLLKSGKSIALKGKDVKLPALTEADLENLKVANEYGVTGIMQPFVRSPEDLIQVKDALNKCNASNLKIYAKIENMDGVEQCQNLLPYCEMIIIARGDLGNAMPLSKLPRVQKELSDLCLKNGKPFMVVTQMLHSMHNAPFPTRAEVSDIFHAIADGAASVMLTGETAAGKYPFESMKMMIDTVQEALEYLKSQETK